MSLACTQSMRKHIAEAALPMCPAQTKALAALWRFGIPYPDTGWKIHVVFNLPPEDTILAPRGQSECCRRNGTPSGSQSPRGHHKPHFAAAVHFAFGDMGYGSTNGSASDTLLGTPKHKSHRRSMRSYLMFAMNVAVMGCVLFVTLSMHASLQRYDALNDKLDTFLSGQASNLRSSDHALQLPTKFAVNYVTPRKDQSMRGTCWDFATIGVLEQSYRAQAAKHGWLSQHEYVSFSEQAYGAEILKLCSGPKDSPQQVACRVAGDSMWKNSTEGGEVPELYYLQYGLKELIFPHEICPYFKDNNGSDSICPELPDREKDNPISFTVKSMDTWYEDMTVKQQLFAQKKAMALSTPVSYVTHYYPCLSRFGNLSDPHCSVEQCTLCPPEMSATTCCIPLKGGRNRNMEGEFFHHRGMTIEGGHAMLLVGYNDAFLTRDGFTGGLIVKNSWLDGPTQGSHSLAYWMQDVSDWEERVVCPNSYNPFNWYQCGNNAAPVVAPPTNVTVPANATRAFNRTKAFDEGVEACLSDESKIYASVNVQPLHLRCTDATQCSVDPNTTYFVRNTTDWGDRMTVMCVWEYNPVQNTSHDFCLKPMLEVDIARTLRPADHEIRTNDPDRCGFYFIPYASIRQYIAQFQGFYVNSFEIEWAPQSFAANKHKYSHLNYTLLEKSTFHQNHNDFDGPFPHARIVAKKQFHQHA
ncbi:Aste57867_13378 [Aphanomyces stellatus]|uniref:Aste57867_13378 protein n=2 Tax=Aphanomyces stellatus TaxID=120398 RepID=A0A485KZP5_9STRA|nr:hypothetical protein As57867_013328 [Aphanomyces stellatus]VFT90217.1 Aste57867_13378 [Aphanomyces stellatus]